MKIYITIFAFLICLKTFTQSQDDYAFSSGLEIRGMAIKDNFLYFGAYNNDYIRKIDLTLPPNQTSTLITNGVSGVNDLMFIGNDLYIAQFNGGKLKKIDVTSSNPVIETVVENLGAPSSLALHNGYLYIAEAYGYKVSRIDLTQTNPIPENVVDYANGPFKIQLYNDELYIAETYGNLISKIDLNDPNPTKENVIENIMYPSPWGITIKDDFLYYDEVSNLFRIDLTDSNQYTFDCNLPNWPGGFNLIISDDNVLYKKTNNGILKYDLNTSLSINEDSSKPELSLMPNSASHFITVNNLKKIAHLKIYNSLGQIIEEKTINGQEPINVEKLKSGLYILNLDNQYTFKFVKE